MLDTALREWARKRLAEIGWADVVVGIPAFNSESTIAHVMKTAAEGLGRHYRGKPLLLIVSDGGSTDYTRETAQHVKLARGVDKLVTIYRGVPGKGTSLRCVFEAALLAEAHACVVLDSDLRSVTPDWVRSLADPVLNQGYDFVSPYYLRHKYDATITNNIARSLTQAVFGRRLRQPIGGDFGLSPRLMARLTQEDVWETDVAKFGIDIWMTTVAICENFKICETFLGSKIHEPKDPSASLGPMFRHVVGTLFEMMRKYHHAWRDIRGSQEVPLLGEVQNVEPEAVAVSLPGLGARFREGFEHFGPIWRDVLGATCFERYRALAARPPEEFAVPVDLWVDTVYGFAVAFKDWAGDRHHLVEMLIPLYYARIAAFVNQTREMTTAEAERVVDEQARRFEERKPDLVRLWQGGTEKTEDRRQETEA